MHFKGICPGDELLANGIRICAVMDVSDRILVLNRGELVYNSTPADIFSHYDELLAMGLNVPSFTKIIFALKKAGLPVRDAYTVEAAADAISELFSKEPHQ